LESPEPLLWSHGAGTDVWNMFQAAMRGDLATMRALLDLDPGLVRGAYEYRGPLYFAVRENQVDAARLLLERGADPLRHSYFDSLLEMTRDRGYAEMERLLAGNLLEVQGIRPEGETISAAIRARDLAAVRSLLDASPVYLHAADARGNRPIHMAVMTRQLDAIDELLARGADINQQRFDGARPIQLANGDYHFRGWRDVPEEVTTSARDVIAHVRARGAYCDICTAAYIGDIGRVRELLDEDPSLANRPSDYVTYYACSGTPLRNAAGGGHIEIVKLLLAHGADPNLPEEHIAPRGHALHMAVCNCHIEIVKLLLAHGAYPNVPVESSADTLSAAIRAKDKPMIELLCSHGASRSVELLAYYGDVKTAAAVFAANPALADDPGALSYAAENGHAAMVRLMLRYRPDLATRIGCAAKSRALTELLFANGMDANHRNWLLITPLHRLAGSGDVENAVLFLDHGADVNARDEELSSTPLGWAAKNGHAAMVELLLSRGTKARDDGGPPWAAPIAWARRRGHDQIVQLLSA
jgi:ankyrin repeat protein